MVCPICVFKITYKCDGKFIPCRIETIKNRKSFKDVQEAVDSLTSCKYFPHERAYIDFTIKQNVFKNNLRHSIWYFANINRHSDVCIQNLGYLYLMKKWLRDVCNE